ncbi:MAG: laccase, partial [Proteobacteria bacterium]|nr:laccase [Pseudomonadota bacterium]
MLCQSKLLGTQSGVFHGFTTREGGASTGSLSSLNLAWCSGEQKESLWANWDKVAKALAPELSAASVALLHQVHGNRVVEVSSPKGPFEVVADADGAVTTKKGIILAVRVADCVPVLLAAPGGVAVAHAGWRGAAAQVVPEAVRLLVKVTQGHPDQVRAA